MLLFAQDDGRICRREKSAETPTTVEIGGVSFVATFGDRQTCSTAGAGLSAYDTLETNIVVEKHTDGGWIIESRPHPEFTIVSADCERSWVDNVTISGVIRSEQDMGNVIILKRGDEQYEESLFYDRSIGSMTWTSDSLGPMSAGESKSFSIKTRFGVNIPDPENFDCGIDVDWER